MKKIHRMLAFAASAAMLFSVTACSDKDYRELFLGKNVQSENATMRKKNTKRDLRNTNATMQNSATRICE